MIASDVLDLLLTYITDNAGQCAQKVNYVRDGSLMMWGGLSFFSLANRLMSFFFSGE